MWTPNNFTETDPQFHFGVFTVEVDQNLDKESLEYLEALAQATEELEFCVNLCKSRVMMVTCFDISMSTPGTQEGLREVEVWEGKKQVEVERWGSEQKDDKRNVAACQ